MAKLITVEIDNEGDQTVDLAGYHGKGCAAVAKAFADAIGTSTDITRKPEFNQVPVKQNIIKRQA